MDLKIKTLSQRNAISDFQTKDLSATSKPTEAGATTLIEELLKDIQIAFTIISLKAPDH